MKKQLNKSGATVSKKGFRLQGKHLFLTYPQCGLKKEIALEILRATLRREEIGILDWLIAEETHEDGSPHLHCYLSLASKLTTRNARLFDLENAEGELFHGNYQTCRSPSSVQRYCQKEGSYLASENLSKRLAKSASEDLWKKARKAAREEGAEAAMSVLESGGGRIARDLCLYETALQRSFEGLSPMHSHACARALTDFAMTWAWPEDLALILWGPTNVGKTTLACSLLPQSLLTRHLDTLATYSSTRYNGVIMDDMAFKHLHREAQIALVDTYFTTQIHVRYKVAVLPKGTRRIVTTNRHPEEIFDLSDPAIKRRVFVVKVQGRGDYLVGDAAL